VSTLQHGARVGVLIVGAAALLGWAIRHSEANFADGLRYIRRAEQIEAGGWRAGLLSGIDHPLHPLGIALVHGVLGGHGPASWQRAALVLCFSCVVLLVVPTYLLTLELFGERAAWMGCLLVAVNPVVHYIVVNVLSECTLLLWWTFGLWAAVRFLREGRFLWLPLATVFGGLAYLTRPEGMLLPAAVSGTLLLLPLLRATRINWPRWWLAMSFLGGGLLLLAGPYVALKGGLGTKPGIARVLGLLDPPPAMSLEREKPLPPGQTQWETYRIATTRMLKMFRAAVTPPIFPFALAGVVLAAASRSRARACLLLALILLAAGFALVRLHAVAGYCTARHALIPGLIMTLAAAHAMTWLMDRISIPARWLSASQERLRPGPAVWAVLIGGLVIFPSLRSLGPYNPSPFAVYRHVGAWLANNTLEGDQVLDLTDWSLFFSQRPGYSFASIYKAPLDPATRWIIVRKPHIEMNWPYSPIVRELIGDRRPLVLMPPEAGPNQIQIRIYDRQTRGAETAARSSSPGQDARRR
jgi:4-amino-4-deoxy-L-arabinose transferase-like glycosyltransferase